MIKNIVSLGATSIDKIGEGVLKFQKNELYHYY